jgi:hypothetical protein
MFVEKIVGITRLDKMVTKDDIPSMPYLNVMIKKTLRKYPPMALLPLQYVNKSIIISDYDILRVCMY